MDITIDRSDEERLRKGLEPRTDFEALRIKRYLSMPDLSRTPGSPLAEIVARVKAVPELSGFDVIDIPEIVPAHISFDLFDFPADHPARSRSDTYYVDDVNILRTHDTVFWYYYLQHPTIKERIAKGEAMGALCYGKVYRKDEIDSRHMNVFHQLGGWYIAPVSEPVSVDNLKNVLAQIAASIFGDRAIRFNPDIFPYTDPSLELELNVKGTAAEGPAKGEWLELLGGGVPKASVLQKLGGVEGYHGWAFGFGIERIAIASMDLPDIRLLWSDDERIKRQLVLGTPYKEVSKYPAIVRDISFVVSNDFVPNDYFDLVREIAGDLVEEVALIDRYENEEKFGAGRVSYAYRITYRSLERTLTNEEIDALHKKLEEVTKETYNATVR